MKSSKVVAVFAAASLLLAGCGGGQQPNGTDPQPASSSAVDTKEPKADGKVNAKELAKNMENAWTNLKFYKSRIDFPEGTYEEYEVDRRNPQTPALHRISHLAGGEIEEMIEIPGDGTYVKEGADWIYTEGGPYVGVYDFSTTVFQDISKMEDLILVGPEDRYGINTTHYQVPQRSSNADFWIDENYNIVELNFGANTITHKIWDHNVPVEIKDPRKS